MSAAGCGAGDRIAQDRRGGALGEIAGAVFCRRRLSGTVSAFQEGVLGDMGISNAYCSISKTEKVLSKVARMRYGGGSFLCRIVSWLKDLGRFCVMQIGRAGAWLADSRGCPGAAVSGERRQGVYRGGSKAVWRFRAALGGVLPAAAVLLGGSGRIERRTLRRGRDTGGFAGCHRRTAARGVSGRVKGRLSILGDSGAFF